MHQIRNPFRSRIYFIQKKVKKKLTVQQTPFFSIYTRKNQYNHRNIKNYLSNNVYCPFLDFKIPHFLDIQKRSFQSFLQNGLIEEFEHLKTISNPNNTIELLFYPKKYKLVPPKWNPKQTILKRKTYACALYIPVQLTNYKTNHVILKWFLVCHLPLMTKNGHFIVNGSPKIIMNQIVRSPGVYFQKTVKSNKQIVYSADFIAQRGTWLRLEMDNKKKKIWAKLKKTPKLPIYLFLRCFGITLSVLNYYLNIYHFIAKKQKKFYFKDLIRYFSNDQLDLLLSEPLTQTVLYPKRKLKRKDYLFLFYCSKDILFLDLFYKIYPKLDSDRNPKLMQYDDDTLRKAGKAFLYKKFLNPRLYNLSSLGRARVNQSLGLTIPLEHTLLTAKDILFACFYLIECHKGIKNTTDIDDLKNRKIRPSGEMIQNQLALGVFHFEKTIREKIDNGPWYYTKFYSKHLHPYKKVNTTFTFLDEDTIISNRFALSNSRNHKKPVSASFWLLHNQLKDFLNSKAIQKSLREFFGTNPLCQLLDQTNPLAEMTHKRRLSSLGLGGINRDTAGMAIRGIHPTHYGRICPIETPEGQNAGLVNSFTIYSRLNKHGFIETPFYQTYKGLVLEKQAYFFSSDQEKQLNLGPGDITKNKLNFLPKTVSIPCRQLNQFKRLFRNEIDFTGVSPTQMISIATSLIPFLEHDDGNRALMGSNMQRQAVPTLKASLPIVGTGLESKIIADVNHGLQINKTGFVSYVDANNITIYSHVCAISSFCLPIQTKPMFKKNQSCLLPLLALRPLLAPHLGQRLSDGQKRARQRLGYGQTLQAMPQSVKQGLQQQYKQTKHGPQLVQHKQSKHDEKLMRKRFQYALTQKALGLNKTSRADFSLWHKLNFKKNSIEIPLKKGLILHPFLSTKPFGYQYFFHCLQKHHQGFTKNDYLFNSSQIFTVFNFGFTDSFLTIWELVNRFSNKSIYSNQTKTFKPFLNKTRLKWLKQVYHKTTLLNYSKSLLLTNPLVLNGKTASKFCFFDWRFKKNNCFRLKAFSIACVTGLCLCSFKRFVLNTVDKTKISLLYLNRSKNKSKSQQNNPFCSAFNKPKQPISLTGFALQSQLNNSAGYLEGYQNQIKNQAPLFVFPFIIKQSFKKKGLSLHMAFNHMNFYQYHSKDLVNDRLFMKQPYYVKLVRQHGVSVMPYKSKQPPLAQSIKQSQSHTNQKQTKQSTTSQSRPLVGAMASAAQKVNTNQKPMALSSDRLLPTTYNLDLFYRSNQDTSLCHRPIVDSGQWVENKDVIADNTASQKGQLALGQNLLIAYMPWEGYNFEDAVLMSDNVISKDLFTTLHIERYETEVRNTAFGDEQITNKLPNLRDVSCLNAYGIAKKGAWVEPGDILVGKITPLGQTKLSGYEKLLYDIIEKNSPTVRDSSLRVPLGVHGRVVHVEILEMEQRPMHKSKKKKKHKPNRQKNVSSKKAIPINFKTKAKPFYLGRRHILNKSTVFNNQTDFVLTNRVKTFALFKNPLNGYADFFGLCPYCPQHSLSKGQGLNSTLQSKASTGQRKPDKIKSIELKQSNVLTSKTKRIKNTISLNIINKLNKVKLGLTVSLDPVANAQKKGSYGLQPVYEKNNTGSKIPLKVHVYIAEKRKIQVGDKIAGRHGNKGIISSILPKQDMPYLSDGTPIDLVLNPLGVPSRMNVGQIFECLLGLAGYYLGQNYKIKAFDEIYGCEASRSLVYLKLYEAKIKTSQNWLFNCNFPGKVRLFDGRTGECFDQPVTVGYAYILKLVHLVDEKIHARATGPYALVTQQPLRGRSKQGGQRVGEMEVWALEGFGAAYILQELLTIKSDDIKGRNQVSKSILNNKPLKFGIPESFKVLIKELQALCLNVSIYKFNKRGRPIKMDILNLS
jgi:DNA-directed RNA polymerase beta subunit